MTPVTASSGCQQDLALVLAPDQPDRQPAAQFAAVGLVPDPAVQAGPQHVQLCFGHGSLHAQQHPVVEQPRMVDAVGVGEQRVVIPARSSSRYQSELFRASRETSSASTIPT